MTTPIFTVTHLRDRSRIAKCFHFPKKPRKQYVVTIFVNSAKGEVIEASSAFSTEKQARGFIDRNFKA